ncbi:MAG: RNA pyrophosphohydrolase [Neomegalonema sp.]|nr:RNA pyrophosphohydrolase [Neomegalonema sp.]
MPNADTPAEPLPYRPCVGLMLLNADGLIFAGRRIDTTAEAWQMPQGGIDEGETPSQAALRELGEETGLAPEHVEVIRETADWLPYDLPEELQGKIWGGKYRGQMQKWFALRMIGPDHAINIHTDEPEFAEWRWLGQAELIEKIVPFKRDVYRRVLDDFADLLV